MPPCSAPPGYLAWRAVWPQWMQAGLWQSPSMNDRPCRTYLSVIWTLNRLSGGIGQTVWILRSSPFPRGIERGMPLDARCLLGQAQHAVLLRPRAKSLSLGGEKKSAEGLCSARPDGQKGGNPGGVCRTATLRCGRGTRGCLRSWIPTRADKSRGTPRSLRQHSAAPSSHRPRSTPCPSFPGREEMQSGLAPLRASGGFHGRGRAYQRRTDVARRWSRIFSHKGTARCTPVATAESFRSSFFDTDSAGRTAR